MEPNNALALISQHKQLIMVAIGIAAIASYMIPFSNLFAIADASHDYWKKTKKVDVKKKKFDFKFIKFFQKLQLKQFQKFSIHQEFIDSVVGNKVINSNFGIQNNFRDIGNVFAGYGGTTTPTGGAVAISQGSNIFVLVQANCPVSFSPSSSATCSITGNTITVQVQPYLNIGGSV